LSKREVTNEKDEQVHKATTVRLNALIRLQIESLKRSETMTNKMAMSLLHSAGLTPSEIAKIMAMKSRTSISKALYSRKSKKSS
jgi:hypothetical protein